MNHQIFERKLLLGVLHLEHTRFRLVLQKRLCFTEDAGRCALKAHRLKSRNVAPPVSLFRCSARIRCAGEYIYMYFTALYHVERIPGAPDHTHGRHTIYHTRAELEQEDPLNLNILISGGKETNQDSLSNGE